MATSEYNYLKGLFRGIGLHHATKALPFILKHHGDQKRNDGSPYYVHPVKVASQLSSLNLFTDEIDKLDVLMSGALLHDILEDTDVTLEKLANEFNEQIAQIVYCLTKNKDFSNEYYYERIRMNLLASLIKIADRCNNISTMAGVFTKERLLKYIEETNQMVHPLIRCTRDNYPEISNQIVSMSYHIKSVTAAIEAMLPLMAD